MAADERTDMRDLMYGITGDDLSEDYGLDVVEGDEDEAERIVAEGPLDLEADPEQVEIDRRARQWLDREHTALQKDDELTGIADVATGLTQELPRSIAHGLGGVVQGAVEFVDDLNDAGVLQAMATGGSPLGILSNLATQPKATGFREVAGSQIDVARSAADAVTVDAPESDTGQNISKVVEFSALFLPMLAPARASGLVQGISRGVGKLTPAHVQEIVAGMFAGAVTEGVLIDPAEQKMAEVLEENPDLAGPVNDYLNSKDDAADVMFDRARNAIKGAALGVVADAGMLFGLQFIRGVRTARKSRLSKQAKQLSKLTDEEKAAALLGDTKPMPEEALRTQAPDAPVVRPSGQRISETDEDAVEAILEIMPEMHGVDDVARFAVEMDNGVHLNVDRIKSADDVDNVWRDMTDVFHHRVVERTRGERSHAATRAAARSRGMTVEDFLKARDGEFLRAEDQLAARALLMGAGEEAIRLSDAASFNNALPEDVVKFNHALAVFQAINEKLIGIRTETARALNQWNIVAKGQHERAAMVARAIEEAGGAASAQASAKAIKKGVESGFGPDQLRHMLTKQKLGTAANVVGAARESYTMGLLWRAKTHLANIASSVYTLSETVADDALGAQFAKFNRATGGDADDIAVGQATARLKGYAAGMRQLFKMWRVTDGADIEKLKTFSKIDLPDFQNHPAIAAEKFNLKSTGIAGRAIDAYGRTARIPGHALGAEDSLFKTLSFYGELYSQSWRAASNGAADGASRGQVQDQFIKNLTNPPEFIRMEANKQALYDTFQDEMSQLGEIGKWARKGRFNPLFTMLPFLRSPDRVFMYTFERIPGMNFFAKKSRDAFLFGSSAEKEIALAKLSMGGAFLMTGYDLADDGVMTGAGPQDARVRESLLNLGWRPFSVRVGDKFYSYQKLEPIATLLGMAATLNEIALEKEMSGDGIDTMSEISAALMLATHEVIMSKAYLRGIAEFYDFIENTDRGGHKLEQVAGNFFPLSTAFGQAADLADALTGDVGRPEARGLGVMGQIQAKLPFLRNLLPKKRNKWGEEIGAESSYRHFVNTLSPVQTSEVKVEPIDAFLEANQIGIGRIEWNTSIDGVPVNFEAFPLVYEALAEHAGNGWPEEGSGLKDTLNEMVTDGTLDGVDPTTQESMILSDVRFFRQEATFDILDPEGEFQGEEFDAFRAHVQAGRDERLLRFEEQGGASINPDIAPSDFIIPAARR